MTEKQIESLRKAYTIVVYALEFADSASKAYGGPGLDESGIKILELQRAILEEAKKESPDVNVIATMLAQNMKMIQEVQSGGICTSWAPNDISPTARVISREENEKL